MPLQRGACPIGTAEIIPCEPDAGNAAEGIVPDKRHTSQHILLSPFVVTFIKRKGIYAELTIYHTLHGTVRLRRCRTPGTGRRLPLDSTPDEGRAEVEALCRRYGATFILDDHVEWVDVLHADGVHLGKSDMPIDEARRLLGQDRIIGGTANTLEGVMLHAARGADYIGCGPFRFTTTKEKLAPTLGLEGYRRILDGMKKKGISLPLIAIGGITKEDIPALMETGVDGIALSGTILRAGSPTEETRNILRILNVQQS